jgi:DNA polymerase III subunit epsilon
MYLFFDTETADLPRRWDAPASDVHNWPRLVQLAWIACDANGTPGLPEVHLIRPEGFIISAGAFQRHGISTARAIADGVPLLPVLERFQAAVEEAAAIVAHNVDFDAKVVGAELIRAGLVNRLDQRTQRCTMKESTNFCRLPGGRGYKWPTLTELHTVLFGRPFDGAHDATADCLACMRCFFALQSRCVLR